MAADQDETSWLPEPPPPHPARRDVAIGAALLSIVAVIIVYLIVGAIMSAFASPLGGLVGP